MHCFSCKNCT